MTILERLQKRIFAVPFPTVMKLHLNLSLRRALLAAMAAVCSLSTAWAGIMHPDASLQTYTDFGQNRGRYVVGSSVNALLSHIRTNVET